mgnify:FL=1|jgi:hypothetical protein|tara:strand:- start:4651 stop:4908 length:258 start_codon:yes stop_codon:yes gene_type:complete
MTKRQINRLTKLVLVKTQKEAVMTALEAGYEPSPADLKAAGVTDPYRVVNTLRYEQGAPIYLNNRYDSRGSRVSRYRLGTPKQHS